MRLKDKTVQRMAELGIAPKRSLGQNFLVSEMVVDKIVKAAEKLPADKLIEIGPGLGALSDRLRELKPLTLIELDRSFAEYWRKQGLEVLEDDALKVLWPDILQGGRKAIVSNLPYQISSRLVMELSFVSPRPVGMILMFQKEVAERLMAQTRTKDYGLLSVVAQTYWDMTVVTNAGMQDFYPSPQVGSRVLLFKPKVHEQTAQFLEFVKAAFAQRRKFLLKNLSAFSADWHSAFEEIGLNPDVRAEVLTPEQFWKLFEKVK